MVSNDLWTDIDSSLRDEFMMIPEKAFAVFWVMTVAYLLQLPSFTAKLIFSQFSDKGSMNNLLGWQLWRLIKYVEMQKLKL